MGLVSNIVKGICVVGIITGVSYCNIRIINEEDTFARVSYILDINRDGKLSSEEIKRFYDETGTTPYTKQLLKNRPNKDFDKFLDRYW